MRPGIPPSEQLYRHLLDEVSAFIYSTDRNGRYTYANQLVLKLLGAPNLEAVLGRSFTDFVDIGEADTTLRETDRQVLEQGLTVEREESNYIHAIGELRTYWSIKKPLRDAEGRINGMLGISYDITEVKRLRDEVHSQNQLLDTVLNNVDALVYMKDEERRFRYANQKTAATFGLPVESIVGRLDSELMPQEAADRFWAHDQKIIATNQGLSCEVALPDHRGQLRHYWSVVVPWTTRDGQRAVIGLSTDITELHQLKEELQRQAMTDVLTAVANRRAFFRQAGQELARSRRHGLPMALIYLDLDHFKNINDCHGHPVGDTVLQSFARFCQGMLRQEDLLARTGGEEFCILLPNVDLDAAHRLAERLRNALPAHDCRVPHLPELRVSASFGVAALNAEDAGLESLFARADRALYAAKERGRNTTVVLP